MDIFGSQFLFKQFSQKEREKERLCLIIGQTIVNCLTFKSKKKKKFISLEEIAKVRKYSSFMQQNGH